MPANAAALLFLEEIQQEYINYGGRTPLGLRYRHQTKWPRTEQGYEAISQRLTAKGFALQSFEDYITFIQAVRDDYSRYEDLGNIWLLESLKKDLRKVFEFSKIPFPENVVLGTAQFGHFNAFATTPSRDSDVRIVVMDDGLFTFLNGLAKIVSMLFEKREEGDDLFSFSIHPDDIDRSLQQNAFAHEKFIELISSYFITGHSMHAAPFMPEYEHNLFTDKLRHTAELFILAHEYGHIVYGHLAGSPEEEQKVAEEFNVQTWQISWAKEMQADGFACMLVMRFNHHLKDMTAEMSFVGIRFLFAALEILSIAKGYKPSATHPAPGQRINNLINSLYADTTDKELVDDMEKFGVAVLQVVHRLWEMNRTTIQENIGKATGSYAK